MAVEFKDYYGVLGVPRGAGEAEIKKAFRRLARQYHPDVAKDKKAAEERFKEINEAYEVLGDPTNRAKYDQLGADWRQGNRPKPSGWESARDWGAGMEGGEASEFEFGGTGFSDFFERFFGRRGRAGGFDFAYEPAFGGFTETEARPRARRGRDVEGLILVTLEEVRHGSIRSVTVRRTDPRTGRQTAHTFKVRLPAGVREGQLIRVGGKGEIGAGGADAGDLYLRVRYAAHPEFRVREADLLYELDLAPWEAVLGTEVEVPTLDGSVRLRVPAGIDSGRQLRVRSRGLPCGPNGQRGDLIATVAIRTPSHVEEDERRLWQELANRSHFRPRSD